MKNNWVVSTNVLQYSNILCLHYNGHFSRWTWVSQYQNVSILDFFWAKNDGNGGDSRSYKTKLQSNCHLQQTNIQLFTGQIPSCYPTISVRALKGILQHSFLSNLTLQCTVHKHHVDILHVNVSIYTDSALWLYQWNCTVCCWAVLLLLWCKIHKLKNIGQCCITDKMTVWISKQIGYPICTPCIAVMSNV